jgi:hypothetical protein
MSKSLKVETGESGGLSPGAYYKESNLARVDINDSADVAKWATCLEMSESELIFAVKEFGPIIRDIRRGRLNKRDEAA